MSHFGSFSWTAILSIFLSSLLKRCTVDGAGFLTSQRFRQSSFHSSSTVYSPSLRIRRMLSSSTSVNEELFEVSLSTSRSNLSNNSRRSFLIQTAVCGFGTGMILPTATETSRIQPAEAAVGTLPELDSTNAVLQGVTIRVADPSQLKSMISFLENGFDGVVLRRRIRGNVEEVWMGFGPEQLSIPSNFTPGVSSFSKYGGHASIRIIYDSQTTTAFYRTGDPKPSGDNLAYLQIAVPGYRVSQMVASNAYIQDAYGFVNVISPSGLPVRGIVGIWPDPMMLVAIRCVDVSTSRRFYEQLGFVEQNYPYSRPSNGTGPFEPAQPHNSVYLAPSPNSMGILLLPTPKTSSRITPNPTLVGLNVVYTPLSGSADAQSETAMKIVDPSGVSIDLQNVSDFEREESTTR